MQTPATLSSGGIGQWGLGLQIGDLGGRRTVGHAGGDRGIATEGFNIVRFSRDGRGAVTALDYHSTGVRRLRFERAAR